jgi:hypothetical protein
MLNNMNTPESSADTGTTETTPQIIEIQDEAMYKLPNSDEPIDGQTLRSRQMMQSDYTKKTQSLSEREKQYQQRETQLNQDIEKLKNQLLSSKLDKDFQQQINPQVQDGANQPNGVTENANTGNDYDWLYDTPQSNGAPTQTQQGINSTPQSNPLGNVSLSDLGKQLMQLPEFRQPILEELRGDLQKETQAERTRRINEQEQIEANIQIENSYRDKYGQKGVDLLYAMEHAKGENNVSRFFELEAERDKLVAEKAIADHAAQQMQAEADAVEQALSGPLVFEEKPDETKVQRKERVKAETIRKAKAMGLRR